MMWTVHMISRFDILDSVEVTRPPQEDDRLVVLGRSRSNPGPGPGLQGCPVLRRPVNDLLTTVGKVF